MEQQRQTDRHTVGQKFGWTGMDRQKDGLTGIQTWSRHAKSRKGERQKKRESER